MNLLQLGDELRLADVSSLLLQEFAVADDVVYWRSQVVVEALQIPRALSCHGLIKILADQVQQLPAPRLDPLEIPPECIRNFAFLQKHFAVAQNVVNRRAQGMTNLL